MRATWTWVCLFGIACDAPTSIPKEEFAERAAVVFCRRTQECDRGGFDSRYFGVTDCRDHQEEAFARLVETMDELDCDYDADKAADAYVEVNEMSCESFYEGDYNESTTEIWTDCGF